MGSILTVQKENKNQEGFLLPTFSKNKIKEETKMIGYRNPSELVKITTPSRLKCIILIYKMRWCAVAAWLGRHSTQ